MTLERVTVMADQMGLVFEKGALVKTLARGTHWIVEPFIEKTIEVVSMRNVRFDHKKLDLILKSGHLNNLLTTVSVKDYERALVTIYGKLDRVLTQGKYAYWNVFKNVEITTFSTKVPKLQSPNLEAIIDSGLLKNDLTVIEVKDGERGLVWVNGFFQTILGTGMHAYWNTEREIHYEIVNTDELMFTHKNRSAIIKNTSAIDYLMVATVEAEQIGLYFKDGEFQKELKPGRYAFWKTDVKATIVTKDMREQMVDIAGQDIMTKDKVTLRINAVVSYKIKDALKAYESTNDNGQMLYREAQLALRAVVGTKVLDDLLGEKDAVIKEMELALKLRMADAGMTVTGVGIRDIILPGDMKELLNKVTEAQKAAEANLIARREEVAAMRSQANTAKILENSPTLMRLKELEMIERVAASSKLNIVLGDKGLTESLTTMI